MIAIAAVAVSIALFVAWLRWIAHTRTEVVVVVFVAVTVVVLLPLLLQFLILSSYFGLGKARRREFSISDNPPPSNAEPDRIGEDGRG
jgi:hypothetical protein